MRPWLMLLLGLPAALNFNVVKRPVGHISDHDPEFGQKLAQAHNGILVSSPAAGLVHRCSLDMRCTEEQVHGTKGRFPVQSVAISSVDLKKQLVCQQVRTQKKVTEYLNGACKRHNFDNNNNNNNNNDREEDDADDEDVGTEIAFVLDGSGSIQKEDFIRAKSFIVNVMTKVWSVCFNCDFAVVQYGVEIQTELLLKENSNGSQAVEIVKNIKQLGNVTKTASAINHVLEHIFVEENGSRNNSDKIIIVISDGKIFLDEMKLTDVLNKPKMKGITRYAIGVGPSVLNVPEALSEMKEIASDPDEKHFFEVNNYAALEEILSKLEMSIIGQEGTSGEGFQLQLAETGFSAHITHDGSVLLGAVGAYDWSGGLYVNGNETFLNASSAYKPGGSYLGYSVDSAKEGSGELYISGAPRYNLTGGVFVFSSVSHDLKQILEGDQVGSYFGSVLCTVDMDGDGTTDYLLSGAPFFHQRGEEGKVHLYKLEEGIFSKVSELHGQSEYIFAQFGSSIAVIGDVDGNGFKDVAVGAPVEKDESSDSSGSIYIFNGLKGTLRLQHSQRISASDCGVKLRFFGQSVSAMSASGPSRQEYISIGSEGIVTVFRTLPVLVLNPKITFDEKEQLLLSEKDKHTANKVILMKVCVKFKREMVIKIQFSIDLDVGQHKNRLSFVDSKEKSGNITLSSNRSCLHNVKLRYGGCLDCFSPIEVKFEFSLEPFSSGEPLYILDEFTPKVITGKIDFERNCAGSCKPNITFAASHLSQDLIKIGYTQSLDLNFNLMNTREDSYQTTLVLSYPNVLSYKRLVKKPNGSNCQNVNRSPDSELRCSLLHPIFRSSDQAEFSISWDLTRKKSDVPMSGINATLVCENNGTLVLDQKTFQFRIQNYLGVKLQGEAIPLALKNEDKKETKQIEIKFELLKENVLNASLTLDIRVKVDGNHTQVKVRSVTSEGNCVKQEEHDTNIKCDVTNVREVLIIADVHITTEQKNDEKIVVSGEVLFDRSVFDVDEPRQLYSEVTVAIRRMDVVRHMPAIIGGSIGGFLLLVAIIILLIKCGFFRRRHQVDRRRSARVSVQE
ncbi:integrin alpha-E-like [Denticeps clupeoides]|uniref:integrin alpha-E-like n=1 Tax=Denticeps clupeoides TaxID=299321 RepID=UPI0010A389E0|nr:integrin alpha-E [Denticeps clupeoides]